MIAAAMGRPRGADLDDLNELSITVRADRPGTLLYDYQTAGSETGVASADGKRTKHGVVSHRGYLTDATFVVAVDGSGHLIEGVTAALERPVFGPFLGRRSCPPTQPLLIGTSTSPIGPRLRALPVLTNSPGTVEIVAEHSLGQDELTSVVRDHPLEYSTRGGVHTHRTVYRSRFSPHPAQLVGSGLDGIRKLAAEVTR